MSTLYGNRMRATLSLLVLAHLGHDLALNQKPASENWQAIVIAPSGTSRASSFRHPAHASPVQLHGELELAWIVGRGRLTRIGEERAYGGDVVLVRDIEHIDDEVGAETLAERNTLRNAHVAECGPGCHSRVAAQVAIELQQGWCNSSRMRRIGQESEDAWFLELTRR